MPETNFGQFYGYKTDTNTGARSELSNYSIKTCRDWNTNDQMRFPCAAAFTQLCETLVVDEKTGHLITAKTQDLLDAGFRMPSYV